MCRGNSQGNQTWTEIFCFGSLIYPIAAAYYGLYKCGSSACSRQDSQHLMRRKLAADVHAEVQPVYRITTNRPS